MAKVRVKTKAVFNGQPVGSIVELDEKTAKKYAALKYLEIIEELKKPKPAKKVSSAPKKTAKASKNAAEKQSKE